jgi:uncharacterized protein YycO
MELKPADLIFVRSDGPIDRIIESITHSPYCHVAGVVKPNELIEAQALRKTGYAALDYYAGAADVYTCDIMTDEQRKKAVEFVIREIGTRYAYGEIAWEFVHFVFHLDLPMKDSLSQFDCSQLWFDAYKAAGINLRPDLTFVAPADLAQSPLLRKVGSLQADMGG